MLKIQKSEKNNKLRSSFSSGLGTPKRTGSAIKNNVTNVLSKKYGYQNTKHLFDGIGDKDIEDNIETAESTIKTNIDRGFLKGDYSSTLPYLCDGLALSYAAAGMGKGRAATRAREAAYTEFEPLIKSTENNLLTTELPKIKEEVSGKNEKPFFTKLIGNPKEEPKLENALYRVGEHGKTQIENALYRVGENEKSQLKNALYQTGEDSRITKLKNAAFRQKDNEKEETSSFGNNAPKPDEALSEIKKSGKMTGFGGADSVQKHEEEKQDSKPKNSTLDVLSGLLAVASVVPGLDTATNIASIPVDIARGDYLSAVLSAVGAIPIVGEVADAAKVAKGTDKVADTLKTTNRISDTINGVKKISPSKLTKTQKITMSEKQYGKLVENIRKNGITDPIKYVEHNGEMYVVDGHHRLRAAKEIGLKEVPTQRVSLPYKSYKTVEDLLWVD